jgi:hypothetical protein
MISKLIDFIIGKRLKERFFSSPPNEVSFLYKKELWENIPQTTLEFNVLPNTPQQRTV